MTPVSSAAVGGVPSKSSIVIVHDTQSGPPPPLKPERGHTCRTHLLVMAGVISVCGRSGLGRSTAAVCSAGGVVV
jgi:hypothetical protein